MSTQPKKTHPPEVQELASQYKVSVKLSDRKFYGKYQYRFTYWFLKNNGYASYLQTICLIRDQAVANGLDIKARHEGRYGNFYTNDLEHCNVITSWLGENTRLSEIAYSLDITKNTRIRKTNLPFGGCRWQIELTNVNTPEKFQNILQFYNNYQSDIVPNKTFNKSIDSQRFYRWYPGSLYFLKEEILQLFCLSHPDSVSKIIEYKLLSEMENV